jgi:hypothetical protein
MSITAQERSQLGLAFGAARSSSFFLSPISHKGGISDALETCADYPRGARFRIWRNSRCKCLSPRHPLTRTAYTAWDTGTKIQGGDIRLVLSSSGNLAVSPPPGSRLQPANLSLFKKPRATPLYWEMSRGVLHMARPTKTTSTATRVSTRVLTTMALTLASSRTAHSPPAAPSLGRLPTIPHPSSSRTGEVRQGASCNEGNESPEGRRHR